MPENFCDIPIELSTGLGVAMYLILLVVLSFQKRRRDTILDLFLFRFALAPDATGWGFWDGARAVFRMALAYWPAIACLPISWIFQKIQFDECGPGRIPYEYKFDLLDKLFGYWLRVSART